VRHRLPIAHSGLPSLRLPPQPRVAVLPTGHHLAAKEVVRHFVPRIDFEFAAVFPAQRSPMRQALVEFDRNPPDPICQQRDKDSRV
jgi:hypothetical protein